MASGKARARAAADFESDELLHVKAQRVEGLRARLRKLGVLYNVTRIVTRTHEPSEALDAILDEVMTASGATSGSIALVEPEDWSLEIHAHRGFVGKKIERCVLHAGEGITGWVAQQGVALLVDDVRTERRYVRVDSRIRSELAVPIREGERVLGVINVDHTRLAAFDRNDQEMLEAVAAHTAGVLRVARLIGTLEARTRALERMASLGQSLVATLETQDVFERVAAAARELLDGSLGGLYLLDDDGLNLKLVSSDGHRWHAETVAVPVVSSRLGEAVRLRRPVRVRNVTADEVFIAKEQARLAGIVSLLAVPVVDREEPLGVLAVYSDRERGFDADEEALLTALAAQAAVAIRAARTHEGQLRVQEERGRHERLILLGVLAAEVAHEIRNPLSVMNLLVHSLRSTIADGDPRAEDLRVLRDKIAHLDGLTGRILGLARSRPGDFAVHDMGELATGVLEFVRPRLERNQVRALLEVEEGLPPVRVVRAEIEQALLNLVLNAEQAMPGGGRLAVRVALRPRSEGPAVVQVSIADAGVGIDPATRVRILEPFFTTRAGGTGLGLSVVHRIVTEHGGALRIRSKLGKGSTFTIEVPAHGG